MEGSSCGSSFPDFAQKLFVQLKLGSQSFEPTKISTEGCEYILEFRTAIKAKFPKLLDHYDAAELVLFEADGTTKINPMDSIDKLNDKKMPLVAVVEPVEVQVQPPQISSSRRQDYKHSKAVYSSRSYLTSIAVQLGELYVIEKVEERKNDPATFADILYNKSRNPTPIHPHTTPLFQMLSKYQWKILYHLNEMVNGHLHLELEEVNGQKQVVLPMEFNHLSNQIKEIAKITNVVCDESNLIVKNEGNCLRR